MDITFKDFIDQQLHRIWEGRHLKECQSKLSRFCRFEGFGNKALNTFKPVDIDMFTDHLTEMGCSNSTINRYLSSLSRVFRYALHHQHIDTAPNIMWKRETKGRPRYFSVEEIAQLKDFFAGHKHWWVGEMLNISLNTGMRRGEILQIGEVAHWDDQSTAILLPTTKNGDERLVPLNEQASQSIKNLEGKPSKYFSNRTFYDTWAQAKAEIAPHDEHFVFHVARHTCATLLANNQNVNTVLIGTILGHRSEATTRKYIHSDQNRLSQILNELKV